MTDTQDPVGGIASAATWRAIQQRRTENSRPGARLDEHRIVLAIEGGGMRGTISAGMALALHDSGLLPSFDAVYGSSAGAISGAWLLSSNPEGLRGWADERWARRLIGFRNLLHGASYVDVAGLVDGVYRNEFPLDFDSVLGNPIALHPMATSAATGTAVDLRPFIGDTEELRTALCASCALPIAAGGPVSFAGEHYSDAGLSESVPVATALADGATHVLLLRTRPRGYESDPDPRGWRRLALKLALMATGHTSALEEALATRAQRAVADREAQRSGVAVGSRGPAAISTVWPSPEVAPPSRTERDGRVLGAAFAEGYADLMSAARQTGGAEPPLTPNTYP